MRIGTLLQVMNEQHGTLRRAAALPFKVGAGTVGALGGGALGGVSGTAIGAGIGALAGGTTIPIIGAIPGAIIGGVGGLGVGAGAGALAGGKIGYDQMHKALLPEDPTPFGSNYSIGGKKWKNSKVGRKLDKKFNKIRKKFF